MAVCDYAASRGSIESEHSPNCRPSAKTPGGQLPGLPTLLRLNSETSISSERAQQLQVPFCATIMLRE